MSIAIQKQIKDNATGVSEFFQDLYRWTEEQGKEEKRRGTRKAVAKGLPISKEDGSRITKSAASERAAPAAQGKKQPEEGKATEEPIRRDKQHMAQYYSNWDRYDVDGTLERLDEEALQQQREEREERQATKDRILDEMALQPDGDRRRTTTARPRVKISVRKSGRRVAPVDLAAPRKEEANRYFAEGRFREAVATYTAALECLDKYEPPGADGQKPQQEDPQDCTGQETEALALKTALLANRALALLKLEDWREAVIDCSEALRFEPGHHKATLRRGFALARLKRWAPAARDLERAAAFDPGDSKAAAELQMARRMLAEQAREARAHARNVLRNPTREPTMPTRRLVVHAKQACGASSAVEPPLPRGRVEVPLAAEPAPAGAAAASAEPAGLAAAGPAAEGGETGGAAPSRRPYVPRSVRMRGRQPAPGQAGEHNAVAAATGAAAVSGTAGSSAVSGPPAMSFYAFEAQWARLRGRPRERAGLLRRAGARGLPALFRDSLDPELVASIAEALAAELQSIPQASDGMSETANFSAAVLGALSRTPRFDLSLRSLSADERCVCVNVLATCREAGACGGEDLDALQQAYEPQPAQRPAPEDRSAVAEEQQPQYEEVAAAGPAVFSLDGCD